MLHESDSAASVFSFPRALWKDIFIAAAIGFVFGISMLALIQFLGYGSFAPRVLPHQNYLDRLVFGVSALLFAPVIENLLLIGIFTATVKATKLRSFAFVLAVLILAALHVTVDVRLAASVWLSFAGFLYVYVKWAPLRGWQQAFWASVVVHSICNAPAILVLLLRLDQ